LSFPERTQESKLPSIFHVNWFRKSAQGKFLWPGFGDNVRVLKWIFDRCDSAEKTGAVDSPVGLLPAPGALDVSGLAMKEDATAELFKISKGEWTQEVARIREFHSTFGDRLPAGIKTELQELEKRVSAMPML
jgi:phosphoenolpyruvate carboxykinase (GTP)